MWKRKLKKCKKQKMGKRAGNIHELTAVMVTYTRLGPSLMNERGAHEVPHLLKDLFAVSGYSLGGEKKIIFLNGVTTGRQPLLK